MNSSHGGRYRERQPPTPMCFCFQSRVQGPMVSSTCPACAIERCIDQGIPPELAIIEDMTRKLEDLHLEACRMHAGNVEYEQALISRAIEEPDDTQNFELNQGLRAHYTSMIEIQQLMVRFQRNATLLFQGEMLRGSSAQSSPGTYQQDLPQMQQNQAEALRHLQRLSRAHNLMMQRDLRTYQGIIADAQRGRQMCTIL